MATVKFSRQRETILQYLRSTTAHPTAETVFRNVRETCPHISQGTVYRNLKLLTDLGEIQRLTCGDGSEHYDATVAPHYHLYCRACGCVADLAMPTMPELNTLAGRYYGGTIEGHTTLFFGECEECTKKTAMGRENENNS